MYTQNGKILFNSFFWTEETRSRSLSASHCLKICYVRSGRILWEIGDKVYEASRGDIAVLNNSERRRFKKIYGDEKFNLMMIEFEPRFLFTSMFRSLFFERKEPFEHIIHTDENDGLRRLFYEIEKENELRERYCEEIISSKLMNIIALLARKTELCVKDSGAVGERMYSVLDYIDTHYTETITLAQLAEMAHMSPSGFSKAFLRCNGIGVMQYIIRKRVARAVYLLEHTDEGVLNIAIECGFNNGASFYQAFKKITGRTPKSFRNAYEKDDDMRSREP